MVVPLALPWPADLRDDPRLQGLHRAVDENALRRWRVLAVPPDDDPMVVAHVLPAGPFSEYERWQLRVDGGDVDEAAAAVVRDPVSAGAEIVPALDELLICTHGRRDVCCGSTGTALWRQLMSSSLGLRVRRTSHLGGHRFAPTALYLPTGTMWAWLDAPLVEQILARTEPFSSVSGHLRGSCALGSAAEQVAELAVLEAVGWRWWKARRSATSTVSNGSAVVELWSEIEGRWQAQIEEGAPYPIPSCGTGVESKLISQFSIRPSSLTRVPAAQGSNRQTT